MSDLISRKAVIDAVSTYGSIWIEYDESMSRHEIAQKALESAKGTMIRIIKELPSAQPERKTGRWILDRSGKYCCNKCMEPCATYMMMKPRDKFCKMCGAKMEVTE